MIIGKISGKPVHHNDCTYCELRLCKDIGRKSRKKYIERCILHNRAITPVDAGTRLCSDYTQRNCECPECKEKRERFDIETMWEHVSKFGTTFVPKV